MQFSNINYNLYKSFLVVFETGNISRAAEILYISQPAVSHNIKELEKQLGIQLFYKKANGMSYTSEAETLYKYISSAFNSIWKGELTISDMAGLKTGIVKIGTPAYLSALYLADIITEFHAEHPNLKIEIVNRPTAELTALLQSQNIDILIDSQPISFEKGKIEIKFLKSYSNCFFASDRFWTDKKLGVDAINSMPLIVSSASSDEIKLLKSTVPDLKLNPVIEACSTETILKLVKKGNGIGYITEDYIKDDLENGSLKKFDVLFTLPKLDVYCSYTSDTIAYAAKRFIEWVISKN